MSECFTNFFYEAMKHKLIGLVTFILCLLALMALDPVSDIPARSSVSVKIGEVCVIPLYYAQELKYPKVNFEKNPAFLEDISELLTTSTNELNFPVREIAKSIEPPQVVEDRLKKLYPGVFFHSTSQPDRLTIIADGDKVEVLEARVMNIANDLVAEHKLKAERLQRVQNTFYVQQQRLYEALNNRIQNLQSLSNNERTDSLENSQSGADLQRSLKGQNDFEEHITEVVLKAHEVHSRIEYAKATFEIAPSQIIEGSLNSSKAQSVSRTRNLYRSIVASLGLAIMAMFIFAFFGRLHSEQS